MKKSAKITAALTAILILCAQTACAENAAKTTETSKISEISVAAEQSSSAEKTETVPEAEFSEQNNSNKTIDFDILNKYFLGTWESENGNSIEIIDYSPSATFVVGWKNVGAIYVNSLGYPQLEYTSGGEAACYVADPENPDVIYATDPFERDKTKLLENAFHRTATAVYQDADAFGGEIGYFHAARLMTEKKVDSYLMFDAEITLDDGMKWIRTADINTRWLPLYLVSEEENKIVFRSDFYADGAFIRADDERYGEPYEYVRGSEIETLEYTIERDGGQWSITEAHRAE